MNKPTPRAPTFAWMVPCLTAVARANGYALGIHGSMNRDLDLIAVPWTADAAPEETLVEAIRAAVDGKIHVVNTVAGGGTEPNPIHRPHGRRGWVIHFSGHAFYIDLSVMPRGDELERLRARVAELELMLRGVEGARDMYFNIAAGGKN